MTQHLADLLVLPGRHLLEHVELTRDEPHAHARPAEETQRSTDVPLADESRGRAGVVPGELEPELGRLVDDLEQQLVPVHPLLGALLEGKELVGVEVALVVAPRPTLEDRTVERRLPGLL